MNSNVKMDGKIIITSTPLGYNNLYTMYTKMSRADFHKSYKELYKVSRKKVITNWQKEFEN